MVFDSLGGTRPENGRRRCFGPVKAGSLAPWNAGAFPDGEALALLKIHAFSAGSMMTESLIPRDLDRDSAPRQSEINRLIWGNALRPQEPLQADTSGAKTPPNSS
jgi:hypothetical protein